VYDNIPVKKGKKEKKWQTREVIKVDDFSKEGTMQRQKEKEKRSGGEGGYG